MRPAKRAEWKRPLLSNPKSFSSDAKIALSPFSSPTGTGIMKLPSLRLFLKMCIFIITKGSMKGEDRKWSRPPFYPERIIWDKPFDIQWKRYCTNPHPFHSQDFSWYFNWIFCEISILLPFLFHDFFQDISMRFSCEISKVPLGLISLLLPFPFVRSEAPAVPSLIYCIIDVPVMTTMIRTRRRVIEKNIKQIFFRIQMATLEKPLVTTICPSNRINPAYTESIKGAQGRERSTWTWDWWHGGVIVVHATEISWRNSHINSIISYYGEYPPVVHVHVLCQNIVF